MSSSDQSNKDKPLRGKIAERRRARSYAMQALYQWHMAGQALNEIEAQFYVDNDFSKVDTEYFKAILHGVPARIAELDEAFSPYLDRPLKELDPVELSILRLSTFELLERIDIPYRVVINEGVELAKTFGATDGHKFINGILDRLAPKLRTAETRQNK